ncbi:MAG TPA: ATP-binding protein, partial [Gammaproteobacteria bacterium]|nr:ATP-binding protein [Gammaproteobacteria bacterium]
IEDILDFSRLQSGKLKVQPVDFCLQDLLDDVVGLLAGQARRKHLDLGYYRISEEVPARVQGDPSRVRQLLINLVGNAVKFTEHGEVAITVSYMAAQENRTWLRFEVKDTGIGIPCEAQAYIFEPFSQVDGSTTRKYSGTGLGLAICRQLVEFREVRSGWTVNPAREVDSGSPCPSSRQGRYPHKITFTRWVVPRICAS